jgi:hypothetical protein
MPDSIAQLRRQLVAAAGRELTVGAAPTAQRPPLRRRTAILVATAVAGTSAVAGAAVIGVDVLERGPAGSGGAEYVVSAQPGPGGQTCLTLAIRGGDGRPLNGADACGRLQTGRDLQLVAWGPLESQTIVYGIVADRVHRVSVAGAQPGELVSVTPMRRPGDAGGKVFVAKVAAPAQAGPSPAGAAHGIHLRAEDRSGRPVDELETQAQLPTRRAP